MRRTTVGLFGLILLSVSGVSTAELIRISTSGSASFPFVFVGGYIFEPADPSRSIDVVNAEAPLEEDSLVLYGFSAPISLRRQDEGRFSLLSLRQAGVGEVIAGGISLPRPGFHNFQNFAFSGQPGVTDVTSVVFTSSSWPPPGLRHSKSPKSQSYQSLTRLCWLASPFWESASCGCSGGATHSITFRRIQCPTAGSSSVGLPTESLLCAG